MNQEIKNILSDLYKIDADLMNYEKDLIKIIDGLILSKPDAKFDDAFKESLKAEIMARAAELKKQNISQVKTKNISGIFNDLFVNRLSFALGGAALVLIIILPVLLKNGIGTSVITNKLSEINFNQKISKLPNQAFGKLSGMATPDVGSALSSRAMGMGGGGAVMANEATNDIAQKSAIAPGEYFPRMINYEYVYAGEDFSFDEKEVEILRRVKSASAMKDFADLFRNVKIDLIDLSKFNNTELMNVNVNENRDFGYSYSISATDGVSIYSNWEKWPHPEQLCRDEACYASFRLKESDVPADSEIIALADNFIREYNIDVKNYGAGEVQAFWRDQKGIPENNIYIPDEISVLYPLLINEKAVYENGGNKAGLSVNVNIRHRKASGVYSVVAQNHESSNYESVANKDDILNLAKKGGMQYLYRYESPTETVKLELDTPVLSYVKHYNYIAGNNQAEELYIPALIFPVKNIPENGTMYYQKNIIVPLAKEIFDQYAKDKEFPQPILFNDVKPMTVTETEPVVDAPAAMDEPAVAPDVNVPETENVEAGGM